jgi:hypothetical protein
MSTAVTTWITGEEYQRERRRLIDAGLYESPEFRALLRRVGERDEYLFERHGRPLIDRYPGKWAAISLDGEVVVKDREIEAMTAGRERWGAGNFCLARLADSPGHTLRSPRVG